MADDFRYLLAFRRGGMYFDIKIGVLRNFRSLLPSMAQPRMHRIIDISPRLKQNLFQNEVEPNIHGAAYDGRTQGTAGEGYKSDAF